MAARLLDYRNEAEDDLLRALFHRGDPSILAVRSLVRHTGMNAPLFVHELFVNRISAFFGMDVLVSAVVLVAFMRVESRRLKIPWRWLPVLAVLTVGVSLGLPMFLYMREVRLEQVRSPGNGLA